jgi:hypothetical protein
MKYLLFVTKAVNKGWFISFNRKTPVLPEKNHGRLSALGRPHTL